MTNEEQVERIRYLATRYVATLGVATSDKSTKSAWKEHADAAERWKDHLNSDGFSPQMMIELCDTWRRLGTPITSLTLGSELAGRITEKEALDLVNSCLLALTKMAEP